MKLDPELENKLAALQAEFKPLMQRSEELAITIGQLMEEKRRIGQQMTEIRTAWTRLIEAGKEV